MDNSVKMMQGYIREFDAKSAGISVLYAEGHMTKEKYDELMGLDKETRIIKTGLFIRDFDLQEKKEKALTKYIELFKSENNIGEDQIIVRASDALWLFNVVEVKTYEWGPVLFREDRTASTLLTWRQFNFYYDSWSGEFFIRGFRQRNTFTGRMKELMIMLESNPTQKALYTLLHTMLREAYHELYEFINTKTVIELIESLIDYLID